MFIFITLNSVSCNIIYAHMYAVYWPDNNILECLKGKGYMSC